MFSHTHTSDSLCAQPLVMFSVCTRMQNAHSNTHSHNTQETERLKVQPEKASCQSALPGSATDKVDRGEMSPLRICPSNARVCFHPPPHPRVIAGECERWRGFGLDTESLGTERGLEIGRRARKVEEDRSHS